MDPSWFAPLQCSMNFPAASMSEHSAIVRELKARGLTPQQQAAVHARRDFIAVAPLLLLQANAPMERSDFSGQPTPPPPRGLPNEQCTP